MHSHATSNGRPRENELAHAVGDPSTGYQEARLYESPECLNLCEAATARQWSLIDRAKAHHPGLCVGGITRAGMTGV